MIRHKLTPRLRSGVTLIELILVLAISAFMIVLALGGLTNRGRSQFDDGVRQVFNNLRKVQNEAASGQWAGATSPACVNPSPFDVNEGRCLGAGAEMVGRGVGFATTVAANNSLQSDQFNGIYVSEHNFEVQTSATPPYARAFYEFYIGRGPKPRSVTDGRFDKIASPLLEKQAKLPAGVGLSSITYKPIGGTEQPRDRGMLNFVRYESDASDQAPATALPFFFNQAYFQDTDALTTLPPGAFSSAQVYDNYQTPQESTITLYFIGTDNSNYKASIVIDTATGVMELKQ